MSDANAFEGKPDTQPEQSDTAAAAKQEQDSKEQSSGAQAEEEKAAEKKDDSKGSSEKKSGGSGGKLENPDSIPDAGGERLGQKHWGESKIVPDVPKLPEDEKVASQEGQPDDQTKDNTAKNTGGAKSGDDDKDGEHKEGFMEKIKDKLGK